MEENRFRFVYPAIGVSRSMELWDKIIKSTKEDKISLVVRKEGNLVVMTEERYKELLGGKKDEEDNI